MKRKKNLMAGVLSLALLSAAFPAANVSAAGKVSLNSTKITMKTGQSKTLKVKNTTKTVKWKIRRYR